MNDNLYPEEEPDWDGLVCHCHGDWSIFKHFRWSFGVGYGGVKRSIQNSALSLRGAIRDHLEARKN